jgi:hypothetical protein
MSCRAFWTERRIVTGRVRVSGTPVNGPGYVVASLVPISPPNPAIVGSHKKRMSCGIKTTCQCMKHHSVDI